MILLSNILTTGEALLIGLTMWGLFALIFFIKFFFEPKFSKKLPLFLKKINVKKFWFNTLKIIGIIIFLYFAGGVEYSLSRIISGLLLFSGIMIIIIIELLSNINEKIILPEITQKEIRRAKLKKIHRKRFRIKNIIK